MLNILLVLYLLCYSSSFVPQPRLICRLESMTQHIVKDMHDIWDWKKPQKNKPWIANWNNNTNFFSHRKDKGAQGKGENGVKTKSVCVCVFFGFQWPSRLACVLVFKVRDEGRERGMQFSMTRTAAEHCIHCPCGLVNILMKEPLPECHHQLHTGPHND